MIGRVVVDYTRKNLIIQNEKNRSQDRTLGIPQVVIGIHVGMACEESTKDNVHKVVLRPVTWSQVHAMKTH